VVVLRREENDRQLEAPRARLAQQLDPVVLAEAVVNQADLGAVRLDCPERLAVCGDPGRIELIGADLGEQVADQDVVVLVVINDQHF